MRKNPFRNSYPNPLNLKVVIFIDWFAPAYKAGGPIQSIVNLVNQPLEGVEYRIVCSNHDLDGQPLQNVQCDQWVWFNPQTQVWYNSDKKRIFSLLKKVSAWQPDIFFINGLFSLCYNFLPLLFGKARRKIVSARGMLHAGALSQKSGKKKIYLGLWKLLGLHHRHRYHATNAEEERFIRSAFGGGTEIFVAQNLPRVLQTPLVHPKAENALELISIGLISPMKNYAEVLRALSQCRQNINYTVYGAVKEAGYWEECKQLIKNLPKNIQVVYHGDLPSANVQQALSKAHVFVLPSKSENFGHAIYEALSAGLPVITSHNTPWNGLAEAKAGFNVSLDNDYELSKAICFFAAANETLLTQWSAGAKAYADGAIDLKEIKNQYRQMFQA